MHITITHYNTFDYTLPLQIIHVLNNTAHITITHYITDYHYITQYHYILPLYYTWHYTLNHYYIECSITYYITHYITLHNSIVSDIDSTIFLPESILLMRGFKCVRMMTMLFCKRGFHTSTAFYSEQIGLYQNVGSDHSWILGIRISSNDRHPRTIWSTLTKLGTKHPWMTVIEVCFNRKSHINYNWTMDMKYIELPWTCCERMCQHVDSFAHLLIAVVQVSNLGSLCPCHDVKWSLSDTYSVTPYLLALASGHFLVNNFIVFL